ncbi:hypothetical protein AYO41_02385 [Verrucomicrobia bacterium SCGC AG-212-E04]|nr:hypothetical protein AYO41_02385 [Verrucomicrobia bacterium SCGC AG-212-E04]
MKTRLFALLLGAALCGCRPADPTELATRSKDENVPNGPFILGFWPGEPRKFALEKAQALTKESLPADSANSRVVEVPKIETAGLPCVVELTFHHEQLLSVYVGFLTRDASEIQRVRTILTERYGPPTHQKSTATSEFQQWIMKKPLPYTVVSGSGPGQLFYVSCYEAGSLFQSALPFLTANREVDEKRIKDLAKKHGF